MTRPPSCSAGRSAGRGVLIRARDRDPARWSMFVRGSRPVAGGEPGPGRPGRCAGRGQVRWREPRLAPTCRVGVDRGGRLIGRATTQDMSRVIAGLHAVPVLLIGGALSVSFMLPADKRFLLAPMIAGVTAVTMISILLLLPRLTRWRLDELHGPENGAEPRGSSGGSDDGDGGWSHAHYGHRHGDQYGHNHHVHGGHHDHCHSGSDSWGGSDSHSSSGSSSSSSYDSSSSSSSSDSSSSTSSC
ncbi:conserved hypothetical protein [Frankia sp. Hr75.2]|nr:conserved hypothetical protein [Frankia sp. Hr75.2]